MLAGPSVSEFRLVHTRSKELPELAGAWSGLQNEIPQFIADRALAVAQGSRCLQKEDICNQMQGFTVWNCVQNRKQPNSVCLSHFNSVVNLYFNNV